MKNSRLLNAPLSHAIALMGHTDGLCIADAGLPIPDEPQRIDLALTPGLPRFLDVLDAVLDELVVESVLLAQEIKEKNPDLHQAVLERLSTASISYTSHKEFKRRSRDSRTVVRTGEFSPFANIILYSGVPF